MKALLPTLVLSILGLVTLQEGYDDTPYLPDGRWRVHDKARPRPEVVTPGTGTAAPSDAIVLFDGTNLAEWKAGNGSEARWKLTDNGAMEVNGTGDIQTRREFGDVQLHLEWRTPPAIQGESQGRGNSGVFLMGRYEVQVLDSHENQSYADGQAAAMYGQRPPDVNASRPAGEWQTYDILFRAPRFEAESGEVLEPALVTVFHNGVCVHHAQPFIGSTTHKRVGTYTPHGETGSLRLQDHGNPVRFRNVWVREL